MCSPTMRGLSSCLLNTGQGCGCPIRGRSEVGFSSYDRAGDQELVARFYCFLHGGRIVVVHAFVKKTEQTPDRELALARRRAREVQSG
jgi:hypothetical protein